MKSYQNRVSRLESLTEKQATRIDSDTHNILEILQHAANEGDIHAKARLEVFGKLFAVLRPTFEAAEKIASTVPADLENGAARHRVRENEIHRLDSGNYQLFSEFFGRGKRFAMTM